MDQRRETRSTELEETTENVVNEEKDDSETKTIQKQQSKQQIRYLFKQI